MRKKKVEEKVETNYEEKDLIVVAKNKKYDIDGVYWHHEGNYVPHRIVEKEDTCVMLMAYKELDEFICEYGINDLLYISENIPVEFEQDFTTEHLIDREEIMKNAKKSNSSDKRK